MSSGCLKLVIGDIDDTFQITLFYPRGGDAVSLRATSVRDCQLWVQMVDNAAKRCREAEKKAARAIVRR
jgi:actin cytoskeleton-regulatory complex protein PAN1